MENRSRRYLNTVKGIAVFLMLWGHCLQFCSDGMYYCFADPVYQGVYSFHMPLFMLVSGYLYFFSVGKRDLKTLLVHRIQAMAQPIVFGTILCNLLLLLPELVMEGEADPFGGVLFSGMGLYWFLWCVLSASIAVGVACKITDKAWLQGVLLVLGFGFVALFPEKDMHLYMYPYFVVGFLWAKHKAAWMKTLGRLRWLALPVFLLMLPQYEQKHFIYITPVYSTEYGLWGSLEIYLFRFVIGLAGSVSVLTIVELVFDWMEKRGKVPGFVDAVAHLGVISLQVYCLSAPLLSGYLPIICEKLIQILGFNVFTLSWNFYHFIATPLTAAAYSAGLSLVVLLMKKAKIHGLIFGR